MSTDLTRGESTPSSYQAARPAELEGNLRTRGLVLMVLSYNAPLAGMAGFVPVVIGAGLGAATPVVYLAIMVLMLLFAVGLVTMARHMTKPGAFYSYVTAGLGRGAGLGAGFAALAGYLASAGGAYVLAGIFANAMFSSLFSVNVSWWISSIVIWAVVSVLGQFNIDVSTRVLAVLLSLEVAIVLLWDARVFINGGPHGRGLDLTAQLHSGSVGFALVFAAACVSGFESIQVFRSETRNPDRTIPRATYLSVVILCGFYALASWAYLVGLGTTAAIASAADPSGGFLGALGRYTNTAIVDCATVMLVTSILAGLLALQNICARYSFALGRDGVLPSWLGQAHPRRHAPTRSAGAVAVVLLVLTLVPLIFNLNATSSYVAMSGIFFWTLVLLMLSTSLAVIVFFLRRRDAEESVWKTLIAPALAVVGFGYVLYESTININVLVGGSFTLGRSCIAAIIAIVLGGAVYSVWLRGQRPDTWSRIGRQDDSESEDAELLGV